MIMCITLGSTGLASQDEYAVSLPSVPLETNAYQSTTLHTSNYSSLPKIDYSTGTSSFLNKILPPKLCRDVVLVTSDFRKRLDRAIR